DSEAAVPAKLQLDEVKLRQVLVNLLDNAVKFTAKGGRVELMIGVDLSRQQLLFSVTDSGIGIPETKVREVFEPFRQVNPRDGQGTGLGLAICRRLVEAMGGQIHLRSEEGRGSCFYFDLPLVEVSDSDAEFFDYAQFEPQEAVLPQGIVKNPAIIIADDVSVNRQVLMGMLADVSNDIREAINGEEVVNQLKERPARLVLMDLRMPVMDGMQATRIIKKDLCMDDVHIVMASATTDEAIMAEAVIAGCDRFLPKPIAMSDVLKVVAETCADPDADAVIISVPEPRAGTRELPLSTPVHNEERQLPPNDVLKALMSGAKLGDITAIREQLALLRKQHTECESFAVEMEEFLNTFDFERMGQVLLNDITEVTTDGA
ncbi:MAG: ATP-binding protein, partial [Spongiibacteraceae bacterium]